MGILSEFDNVDQLAMIMAHEISHVLMRHGIRQMSRSVLNKIALAFAYFSFEFGLAYVYCIEKFEEFYKLKHSRVHESRADANGLKLLSKSGFDIHEAPKIALLLHCSHVLETELSKDAKAKENFKSYSKEEREKAIEANMKKVNLSDANLIALTSTHPSNF